MSNVEFSVFSQFGEDGIISWLIHQIPNIKKTFLEIGTQDYWESNTRFLIQSHNWKGYLIEASTEDVKKIKRQSIYWKKDLTVINEFITRQNINSIIEKKLNNQNLGLLSIDIDGVDYWILDKINLDADIIVSEFNPIFGDIHEITVPYDEQFDRKKKHFSNLFFGCSIQALIKIMNRKNYYFLGTNSQGMNAFFINNRNIDFIKDKVDEKKIFFPIIKEGRDLNGNLNFNQFFENLDLIKNEEVFDIQSKKMKKILDFGILYSKMWQNKF